MSEQAVGNITITARPDSLDSDQISEMLRSKAWALFSKRVNEMIDQQARACETSADTVQLMRAQGAVAALRRVLEVPSMIRREAQDAKTGR